MRKITTLILVAILMLSLSACGGKTKEVAEREPKLSVESGEEKTEPSTEVVEEKSESSTDENKNKLSELQENSYTELTAGENGEFKIRVAAIEDEDSQIRTLSAEFENNSDDKTYEVKIMCSAINKVYVTSRFIMKEIEPKEKANSSLFLENADTLREKGVGQLTDIELTCYISSHLNNDKMQLVGSTVEKIHVYPYGEDKATKYVREIQDSDTILFDNEIVSVVATDFKYENNRGSLGIFVVNKTDKELSYQMENLSINGNSITTLLPWKLEFPAGYSCFEDITWGSIMAYEFDIDTSEENSDTDVKKIEFVINVDDESRNNIINESVMFIPQ